MPRLFAILTATLLAVTFTVRAADPPAPAPATSDQTLDKAKQQAAFEQERLRREFSAA